MLRSGLFTRHGSNLSVICNCLSLIYDLFWNNNMYFVEKKKETNSKTTYSRLSLSRVCLSRITAYLEVKIWSLFKHADLTTGNKILWKRGEIAPLEPFLLFPTLFQYISNFRSQIRYSFVECGCSIYFFMNSANLI